MLNECACRQANETVENFLFRCRQWTEHRAEMLQCTDIYRSILSSYLGGKSPSDDKNWSPDMQAVRANIRFGISTGHLIIHITLVEQLARNFFGIELHSSLAEHLLRDG